MNIFVLSTGRTATLTFTRACKYITNYTVGHETRCSMLNDERFNYPKDHIEIDNRLSWLLGRLDNHFGDQAFYVHMVRDPEEIAKSFNKRWKAKTSIISCYTKGILKTKKKQYKDIEYCFDYIDTVNKNISLFLKDKQNKMIFDFHNPLNAFKDFWRNIHAEGNLEIALKQWDIKYNKSKGL